MPKHVLQDSSDWISLMVSRLCLQVGQFPLRLEPRGNSIRVAVIGMRAVERLSHGASLVENAPPWTCCRFVP